jgi:cyclopropane-fatty-acyl-phospholipid synthase
MTLAVVWRIHWQALQLWLTPPAEPQHARRFTRNIHAHYDLGNDFYRLWLDGSMTYSAGLFEGDHRRSLEQAQAAKYERICRQLALGPAHRVLEIGCGWGGFAEYAARTRGCRVHGVTLSTEQLAFAEKRIDAAGLSLLATFELIDYRDVEGSFDHIVSIEMFEAVGEHYWPDYFRQLHARLKRGGRAIVQTIVIADALFERYRSGTDFIQQYVFPGGMLPSPEVFARQAAGADLSVIDRLAFGGDYALTLAHWHRSFDAAWPEIAAQGFDERFRRLWRFYLAYCEAGFRSGATDVYQFLLEKPRN